MARVRPLRAWRYARTERDITPLVAPPYDVVSDDMRTELLARDEHNAVALELPEGPLDPEVPGNRYETGASRWAEWRDTGVLRQDDEPAFYVLEQSFEAKGRTHTRRALMCSVRLAPFSEGVVIPHERTLPKALGDRFALTRATAANFSPVFSLFDDAQHVVDRILDPFVEDEPLEIAVGDDGVTSRLWAINDAGAVSAIEEAFAEKRLFIADGHHRYTTALAYRDERRAASGAADGDPDYDYVLMALVNMDHPDLVVLPTHRVARASDTFDADAFLASLSQYFDVTELPDGHPSGALDDVDRPAFLVQAAGWDRPRLAVLRDDVDLDVAIPLERSEAWKQLDVAVLQELVLDPVLDIHPDRPETLERLGFVKDAHDAFKAVRDGDEDAAFVLRATGVDQLRAVALAGDVMPQKSTYFYPKLLSGMLFRSMD